MSPRLALALTAALIFWLFRRDMRLRKLPSRALWIPGVWLALVGSKSITLWLAGFGIYVGGASNLEGNPVDMVVFVGLIGSAAVVLMRRGFDWGGFVQRNKALVVIYLYLALSALWAEYSLPTLKRALKDFGGVLVVLVLLTEVDPLQAMRIVYVRVSYLLFPLSVVLIKYFPSVGRTPDRAGSSLFTGVCTHKNTLGLTVFVFGLFLVIDLWQMKQRREVRQGKADERIRYGMLAMAFWLLLICDSKTSLVCLILGCALIWATGRLLQMQDPKRMLFRCLAIIVCVATLEVAFNISGIVLETLGRDRTLTGRTEIWEMVKDKHTDPLFGCGFYSFWSTTKAEEIAVLFKGALASAHNGLLEMYLDCGGIGVALLVLLLLTWGRRSIQRMLQGAVRGRIAVTFWILAIIYNFSETDYFRLEPLWFTLLAMMVECPPLPQEVRLEVSAENLTATTSVDHTA